MYWVYQAAPIINAAALRRDVAETRVARVVQRMPYSRESSRKLLLGGLRHKHRCIHFYGSSGRTVDIHLCGAKENKCSETSLLYQKPRHCCAPKFSEEVLFVRFSRAKENTRGDNRLRTLFYRQATHSREAFSQILFRRGGAMSYTLAGGLAVVLLLVAAFFMAWGSTRGAVRFANKASSSRQFGSAERAPRPSGNFLSTSSISAGQAARAPPAPSRNFRRRLGPFPVFCFRGAEGGACSAGERRVDGFRGKSNPDPGAGAGAGARLEAFANDFYKQPRSDYEAVASLSADLGEHLSHLAKKKRAPKIHGLIQTIAEARARAAPMSRPGPEDGRGELSLPDRIELRLGELVGSAIAISATEPDKHSHEVLSGAWADYDKSIVDALESAKSTLEPLAEVYGGAAGGSWTSAVGPVDPDDSLSRIKEAIEAASQGDSAGFESRLEVRLTRILRKHPRLADAVSFYGLASLAMDAAMQILHFLYRLRSTSLAFGRFFGKNKPHLEVDLNVKLYSGRGFRAQSNAARDSLVESGLLANPA